MTFSWASEPGAKICHKNQSVTNFIGAGKNLFFLENALVFLKKNVVKSQRSSFVVVKTDFACLTYFTPGLPFAQWAS